jgi:hypothetical protein
MKKKSTEGNEWTTLKCLFDIDKRKRKKLQKVMNERHEQDLNLRGRTHEITEFEIQVSLLNPSDIVTLLDDSRDLLKLYTLSIN